MPADLKTAPSFDRDPIRPSGFASLRPLDGTNVRRGRFRREIGQLRQAEGRHDAAQIASKCKKIKK